ISNDDCLHDVLAKNDANLLVFPLKDMQIVQTGVRIAKVLGPQNMTECGGAILSSPRIAGKTQLRPGESDNNIFVAAANLQSQKRFLDGRSGLGCLEERHAA